MGNVQCRSTFRVCRSNSTLVLDTLACWFCRDRKRWILSVPVKGELWLDSGAVAAVRDHKKSLFAAGILKITGDFAAQDAIVLCDSSGYEFARGLCNYTLKEVQKVQVWLMFMYACQSIESLSMSQ